MLTKFHIDDKENKYKQLKMMIDSNNVLYRNLNGVDYNSMEENLDSLEDSPLLINDDFQEEMDEFHCHDIIGKTDDSTAWKKLSWSAVICCSFMVTEIVGGYLAGSLAIMSDAAHLFGDLMSFLLSLLSIWFAQKPSTKRLNLGYHRAEVIGALISVEVVWILSAFLCYFSIKRIYDSEYHNKSYDIDANTMLIVATFGLGANFVMVLVLHGLPCWGKHSHSHGDMVDEQAAFRVSSGSGNSIIVRAAAAHVLSDICQSAGVMVAALVIKYYPAGKLADPICTLLFSVLAVCVTARVTRDSLLALMEGNLRGNTVVGELSVQLEGIPGVRHVHSLALWALAPDRDALIVHLAVDQQGDRDSIMKEASQIIKNRLNLISYAIQIEPYNSTAFSLCQKCLSSHSS